MTAAHLKKVVYCLLVCCMAAGSTFTVDIAMAGEDRADGDELYVRKSTWQETMLATRRAVSTLLARQDSARRHVELGPWYSTGALWAQDFCCRLFPEESVDIDARGADGNPLWRKRPEYADGRVHRLSDRSPASTYLFRTITAAKPVSFEAGFGSNDGIEIWLNGRKLLSNNIGRKAAPDQEKVALNLVEGPNRLLVKIFNHSSRSGFYFSLQPDPSEALWRRIEKDFPEHAKLMSGDIPEGRASEWFHAFEKTELEEKMLENVLAALGAAGAGIRKELRHLQLTKASPDDRRRLDLYLKACRFREKMRCLEVISFEAMRASIDDMAMTYGRGYQKASEYLRRADWYERRLFEIQNALAKDDESAWGELSEFVDRVRPFQREILLNHPILEFDSILFTKRVPGSYSHMSDQYYGWWSRPGGGIYILRNFKSGSPTVECITASFKEPGSFLRPMLSYDAKKILFAWCKHYPHLADEKDKMNKANVPEDAFYHVFEMNIDGAGVRKLTHGKYDDFDARYLPNGRIVFLSTRRGHFLQCGPASAALTLVKNDLPDIYVRCGGGLSRPVAIYTLHTMNPDGSDLCAISPFENFEWTPSVADDGTIIYARWDYVDRHNQPFMSLWAINPDGTNARIVYGNFTHRPNCTFEARSVPNSNKIAFTGSAHHAQTMGSLVLLDPTVGSEGESPMTRLTPEVPFPEIEGWPEQYYANPWPLSERFYLVAWGKETNIREGRSRMPNGMGLYLYDAQAKHRELLYHDPEIGCACPIPLRPRKHPPTLASTIDRGGPDEGCFLVTDVCRGLRTVKRGDIKALRIVAIPPKTHPRMNYPPIGHTRDDPGKCVLGTVPVEEDGSAYFRVPGGMIVFFQALDARGMAVQTMRSATHVQPGQTLSCIGCHESRHQAPPQKPVLAAMRRPSRITVGPEGSWPLRFDRLVQPVLDRHCVGCHSPQAENKQAAAFDLTAEKSYDSLCNYGQPSLREHVSARYNEGRSIEGACAAATSAVLARIAGPQKHNNVELDDQSLERLIIWMDTYAQKAGSFSPEQEEQLSELRKRCAGLLIERQRTGPDTLVMGGIKNSENTLSTTK